MKNNDWIRGTKNRVTYSVNTEVNGNIFKNNRVIERGISTLYITFNNMLTKESLYKHHIWYESYGGLIYLLSMYW